MWRQYNILPNNQWNSEEIKEKYPKILETQKKHNVPNSMGHSKSNSKREVYSNINLP